MNSITKTLLTAFFGGAIALGGAYTLGLGKTIITSSSSNNPAQLVNYVGKGMDLAAVDFTIPADKTIPAVVHIQNTGRVKARSRNNQQMPDFFRDFFGDQAPNMRQQDSQPSQGSGSGVIISEDGYIVTNNHVIDDAEELKVILNDKQTYVAKLIGTDPNTDIALIKIDAKNLPIIQLTDSDKVRVGQWVVAVGNPFNLASTVTAGIVSAKGRNINILGGKAPIESFIQTDAAINPGNSGGALVDLNGDLVGINTAIATPTGSYAGYGFAVPSNIVAKIVGDLKEFGVVQRAYLGAMIRGVDGAFAKEKGLSINSGVYIDSIMPKSAALNGGLKKGDIIIRVDGKDTPSSPELMELIGRKRPGDQVTLSVNRNGKEIEKTLTLNNGNGNTEIVTAEAKAAILDVLGASFEAISSAEAKKLDISGGVKVSNIVSGKISSQTDMREGFIITGIDNRPISSVEDITRFLEGKKGGVLLEGVYPNSARTVYYGLGL